MGSDQSQPKTNSKAGESGENVSPTVEIDRSEIPEAYKVVRISDNVFKRVKENMNDGEERKTQSHSDAKPRTTEDRKSLKKSQTVQDAISLEHVEEVKKAFDETVEKVQKQFFNYRRENACAENESEIIKCLGANATKVLNCEPLWAPYNKCINAFHEAVLKEKAAAPVSPA